MIGSIIILTLCACLGISVCLTFKAFTDGELWERSIGIAVCILLGILVSIVHFACLDNVKHQTMQDYFDGKIEVIEQVDTTRTFKFN